MEESATMMMVPQSHRHNRRTSPIDILPIRIIGKLLSLSSFFSTQWSLRMRTIIILFLFLYCMDQYRTVECDQNRNTFSIRHHVHPIPSSVNTNHKIHRQLQQQAQQSHTIRPSTTTTSSSSSSITQISNQLNRSQFESRHP
ncbi:hypothetical protein BLOT_007569 [Blomia tropicalis]|nr:hypothetical protein BLOT_007569 [Blomia tropicalis]